MSSSSNSGGGGEAGLAGGNDLTATNDGLKGTKIGLNYQL